MNPSNNSTPLDAITDPNLRAAVERFAQTGIPDDKFAEAIRSDAQCQAALEYLFDREMALYQSFFASASSNREPSQPSAEPPCSSVQRLKRFLPFGVTAAAILVALAGSWSGVDANRSAKVEIARVNEDKNTALARASDAEDAKNAALVRAAAAESLVGTWPDERRAFQMKVGVLQSQLMNERQQVSAHRKTEEELAKQARQLQLDAAKWEKEAGIVRSDLESAKKRLIELTATEASLQTMYKNASATIDRLKDELAKSGGPTLATDVLVLLQYRTRPAPLGLIDQIKSRKTAMGDPHFAYRNYLLNSMSSKRSDDKEVAASLQYAANHDGPWTAVARAEWNADNGKLEPLVKLLVQSQRDLLDERIEENDHARRLTVNFAASQAMSYRWLRYSKKQKEECVAAFSRMFKEAEVPPVAVYLSVADLGIRASVFPEIQDMQKEMEARRIPQWNDKYTLSPAGYFVHRTGLEK